MATISTRTACQTTSPRKCRHDASMPTREVGKPLGRGLEKGLSISNLQLNEVAPEAPVIVDLILAGAGTL